jgi:hypothetical protein
MRLLPVAASTGLPANFAADTVQAGTFYGAMAATGVAGEVYRSALLVRRRLRGPAASLKHSRAGVPSPNEICSAIALAGGLPHG